MSDLEHIPFVIFSAGVIILTTIPLLAFSLN